MKETIYIPMPIRLEVTRLHKLEGTGATKAFVDLSVCDSLIIKGIRIMYNRGRKRTIHLYAKRRRERRQMV
jgi:DNA-binding cell septation regulator SpoVG